MSFEYKKLSVKTVPLWDAPLWHEISFTGTGDYPYIMTDRSVLFHKSGHIAVLNKKGEIHSAHKDMPVFVGRPIRAIVNPDDT